MEERNIISKNIKKERIKISNLNDFKDALKREGYKINGLSEVEFKEELTRIFKLNISIIDKIYSCIDDEVIYTAKNIKDFIDYMEKIILFENEHYKLCKKISNVEKLNISRMEYERVQSSQDNVKSIIEDIEKIKDEVSRKINNEDKLRIDALEEEIGRDYLYAKDIELLKKIVLVNRKCKREDYDTETKIKTISIKVPKDINHHYITPKKGSLEYHEHLNSNIPRMKRLIKNIDKYMKVHKEEKTTFKINQSKALQDSINIAVATFHNKEFKAISGSNDIKDYCKAPLEENAVFKSNKVNKLGKLGIGYNRVNDSEKKIFEEIHRQIEEGLVKDCGELILYSKWEPCPSCYFVISQFCKKHPNIKVQVNYSKKYGE